jgi:cytochrome P450
LGNSLYSLAAQPEYLEPLREEIRATLADNDGVMTYRALQQMEKLDSYMKEIMRFYPPAFSKSIKPYYDDVDLQPNQHQ